MAETRKKKSPGLLVWVVIGLLILALGGFGIGGFGGNLTRVATVGDREITVQEYADALRAEQARLRQQADRNITMQEMRMFGIDQAVMERLLAAAALAEEAQEVGVSVGDAVVARRIRANPAFAGVDGAFDREGYAFTLDRAGLSEARYEEEIRDEIAREILQAAVIGGTSAPGTYAATIAAWIAETRDITLASVTEADLPGGVPAPTEEDLRTFYEANEEAFETPELRRITYAWITPEMLAEETEVEEAQVRELYEDRADEFRRPERVLAERLAFTDAPAAEAALAEIEAGETTFDALVEARGLTLDDVDQGDLSRADLAPEAAEALFALEEPGIVGPVETPLGPALYRVNAILDATETPFEDVEEELAALAAVDVARRRIDAARESIDDLLAGGATLEELADETILAVDTIDWNATGSEGASGVAAYEGFREAAAAAEPDDFPELVALSDGGLLALRLDEVVAPRVLPLEEVRAEVEAAWRAETLRRILTERAEFLAEHPTRDISGTPEMLEDVARDAVLEGTPAALLEQVFAAEAGDILAVEGDENVAYVVRIDAVNAADLSGGRGAELRRAIANQAEEAVAGDLFEAYGRAVQSDMGITVEQQAVQAVQSQMGGA
ncbi:Peptidyl-prolyl cis-trans isomerase D [Jannaschia seosinensis]|uniref:Parvulin-like PPIase n=1 Tax=Jannaschia seosinensis TaxID=313367 RepID=A0A0M7BG00_9RHOB|nr:peptidylprolyl isomerase [Jannaschia seosinensis]CUH40833.1 Peptidyl-prolyl cis-trans isomerase D [Jannaschia seosinensis]